MIFVDDASKPEQILMANKLKQEFGEREEMKQINYAYFQLQRFLSD